MSRIAIFLRNLLKTNGDVLFGLARHQYPDETRTFEGHLILVCFENGIVIRDSVHKKDAVPKDGLKGLECFLLDDFCLLEFVDDLLLRSLGDE